MVCWTKLPRCSGCSGISRNLGAIRETLPSLVSHRAANMSAVSCSRRQPEDFSSARSCKAAYHSTSILSVHHSGAGVDSAEKLGADLAHKLAAGEGPDAINKLRSASTDDVFKAAADMGFDAVVDGWVLSDQPLVMFAHHQQADVPVMVGSTAREFSNLIGSDEVTLETFRDWVKNSFQPLADDVLRMYPVPSSADARD